MRRRRAIFDITSPPIAQQRTSTTIDHASVIIHIPRRTQGEKADSKSIMSFRSYATEDFTIYFARFVQVVFETAVGFIRSTGRCSSNLSAVYSP